MSKHKHVKKQRSSNRQRATGHRVDGLSWKRMRFAQHPHDALLVVENSGGDVRYTNYFDSEMAQHGFFFLSWNASVVRILVPDAQLSALREMATGKECVITRGTSARGGADSLELMFDDHSAAPLAITLCPRSSDGLFAGDDKPFTVAAWTRNGKAGEWVGRYRTVKDLPCLRPWGHYAGESTQETGSSHDNASSCIQEVRPCGAIAPPSFFQSTPDAMDNPANIIHRYTRAQALADGTLTSANIGDLAAVTAQHFAGLTPIPSVVVAFYLMGHMRAAARDGFDIAGIWRGILVVATAASNPSLNGTMARVFYDCLANGPRRWSCTVRIGGHDQAVIIDIGPGDEGEPVVTFMTPDDD